MLCNVEKLLVNLRDSRFVLYTQYVGRADEGAVYAVAKLVNGLGELRGDSENRGLDFELAIERLENAAKERFSMKEFSGARRPVFESHAKKVFVESNRPCVTAQCAPLGIVDAIPYFHCTITTLHHVNPLMVVGRSLDEILFTAIEEASEIFFHNS